MLVNAVLEFSKAFFEFIEEQQPIELPAKPCKSETIDRDTKLKYERTEGHKTRAATRPQCDEQ